jgi:hypothetical protein
VVVSEPSKWQRGDLSAGVARLGSSCRSVARWRGLAMMAPRRLCVRVGMRAAVFQSQPGVRAGIRVAEGRWRSGRCRGPTPFVRVGPPAEADPPAPLPGPTPPALLGLEDFGVEG